MKSACGPNDLCVPARAYLTVAGDLSAIGGAEIAQLRIVEGLASAGWTVELQYVSRGDLWPRWNSVASSTRIVRASGLQRSDTAPEQPRSRGGLGRHHAESGPSPLRAQPGRSAGCPHGSAGEADSRGRPPPPAAPVSSAEMAERPHQNGGCRNYSVVGHGGTMDEDRRAVSRSGNGDPHRDRHWTLRADRRRGA